MYRLRADLAAVRVWKIVLQTNSFLIVLNTVSTMALKLLYSSSSDLGRFRHTELALDFANYVALQAANDFAFALSVFRAFFDIGKCRFVAQHSDDGHAIECGISLSIAASVQSEPMCSELLPNSWTGFRLI